jgi:hypothetical protein
MKTPHFNGPDYSPESDHERLAGQHERIRDLMLDGRWRTLQEIQAVTEDPESSISAQLRHLRKPRFGSHHVDKRRRGDGGSWEYKVYPAGTNEGVAIGGNGAAVGPPTKAQARQIRADLFAMRRKALEHKEEFEFKYPGAARALFLYLEYLAGDRGKVCPECSRPVGRTHEGMWCPEHGIVEVQDG